MKKRRNLLKVIIVACMPFLAGCAAAIFDSTPAKTYDGPPRNMNDVALIRGQAYKKSYGNWIQAQVKEVDGKPVFSELTTLRSPYIIYITPGTHELTILGGLGVSDPRSTSCHPLLNVG